MSTIRIHFDGDIAENHKVSLRTLGKTLAHLQAAMDRAYLENKHGNVWKHARMSSKDYEATEFLVQEPEEGGYIIDFISDTETGKKILDRVAAALKPAVESSKKDGHDNMRSIAYQIETRETQIQKEIIKPMQYEELVKRPSKKIIRKYGDRSITKEIDQFLSILRSKYSGRSYIDLEIYATKSYKFSFDKETSALFHQTVSERSLGEPVIYRTELLSLDSKSMNGKIRNLANDRTAIIHFHDLVALRKAKEFLAEKTEMNFIGCPLIEYGAFDPEAGDIYFIDLM